MSESPSAGAKHVLTPAPPRAPRINGPRVFGVRPGSPFLYTIPATGDRPMAFSVGGLPRGLDVDAATGRVTGRVDKEGAYEVTFRARNALGEAERGFRIVVGERICLTPPLGWNSWNCWAGAVDGQKVRAAARAMAGKGLVHHGWQYVNIDDTWQGPRGGEFEGIQGNGKFPDMKGLCDHVHSLGLKVGIYSTPWITSYAGFVGGSSESEEGSWSPPEPGRNDRRHGRFPFAASDAKQWAAWGIDYLKYDWNPNDVPHVGEMAEALRASGRDVVYSLSNSAPFEHAADWARLANCWRTTGDINDSWDSVSKIGFSQDRWAAFAGPGHWNDPDMLVVGDVGWGPELHPSRLTPDEQYTHVSLWCLLAAPLLIGCDMERLDDFTLSLLTNDEVLDVDQDALGRQARRVSEAGGTEVWAKEMEDGSRAAGLFNTGPERAPVTARWDDMQLEGPARVRDLWRQKDLGVFEGEFTADVPAHGILMTRVFPDER